jgi:hypothetical protein
VPLDAGVCVSTATSLVDEDVDLEVSSEISERRLTDFSRLIDAVRPGIRVSSRARQHG